MNDDYGDITNSFVTEGEREISTIGLGIQDVERAVQQFVFTPSEFFVGMVDELVRHNTKRQEHYEERVNRTDHGFAPCRSLSYWAALPNRNDNESHSGGNEKGKQESLVDSGPSKDVDRDHGLFFFSGPGDGNCLGQVPK